MVPRQVTPNTGSDNHGSVMTDTLPTVLLTRPREASDFFAKALRGRSDAPVLIAPVFEIAPVGDVIDPRGHETLVFTSPRAVARVRSNPGQLAWCVGDATARAAAAAGFAARSANGDAQSLIAQLLGDRPAEPILHVRGLEGTREVCRALRAQGLRCDEIVAYRQEDAEWNKDVAEKIVRSRRILAPVFSPRSAQRVSEQIDAIRFPGSITAIAISAAAAHRWSASDTVLVAPQPTAEAMLDTLIGALERDSPC